MKYFVRGPKLLFNKIRKPLKISIPENTIILLCVYWFTQYKEAISVQLFSFYQDVV